jgi:hypothetical protein
MLIRSFFVELAATIVFFVIFALVSGFSFLLILYVNQGSRGISAWLLPLFARGMAAAISTDAAIAANDKVFKDVPRRPVAITIFSFWAVGGLVALLGISLNFLFIDDLDWNEFNGDLVFIAGAVVSCMIVWKYLWPRRGISNLSTTRSCPLPGMAAIFLPRDGPTRKRRSPGSISRPASTLMPILSQIRRWKVLRGCRNLRSCGRWKRRLQRHIALPQIPKPLPRLEPRRSSTGCRVSYRRGALEFWGLPIASTRGAGPPAART